MKIPKVMKKEMKTAKQTTMKMTKGAWTKPKAIQAMKQKKAMRRGGRKV
jgi:hypothetical protein